MFYDELVKGDYVEVCMNDREFIVTEDTGELILNGIEYYARFIHNGYGDDSFILTLDDEIIYETNDSKECYKLWKMLETKGGWW